MMVTRGSCMCVPRTMSRDANWHTTPQSKEDTTPPAHAPMMDALGAATLVESPVRARAKELWEVRQIIDRASLLHRTR